MKFKVKCWREWGNPRDCGYNAYGNSDIINVDLEADNETKIKEKLIENKLLVEEGIGRNRYKVLSVHI